MVHLLKQRLIGAIVLVAFVVITVPLFLDGQKVIMMNKSLIPEKQQKENNRETIILDLKRNSPIPLIEDKKEIFNFEEISKTIRLIKAYINYPRDNNETNIKKNIVIKDNSSNDKPWIIQLGSFSLSENANKMVLLLNSQGHKAYFVKNFKNNELVYRVWLGPQRTKREAEELSVILFSENHENQVVPY